MTQQELKENYIKFLSDFGLTLSDEEVEKRLNIELHRYCCDYVYPTNPEREDAIRAYKITCNDFNVPVTEYLKYLSTSQIWDYTLRNVNVEIEKRFGTQLNHVTDIIRRKHVKDAITALFDQRIYIDANQVNQLIEAAGDNDTIVEVYLSFGGIKEMFNPSVLYEDDDYLDEEYYKNEEEYKEDYEEVE